MPFKTRTTISQPSPELRGHASQSDLQRLLDLFLAAAYQVSVHARKLITVHQVVQMEFGASKVSQMRQL
jgi:hypothetical protein